MWFSTIVETLLTYVKKNTLCVLSSEERVTNTPISQLTGVPL